MRIPTASLEAPAQSQRGQTRAPDKCISGRGMLAIRSSQAEPAYPRLERLAWPAPAGKSVTLIAARPSLTNLTVLYPWAPLFNQRRPHDNTARGISLQRSASCIRTSLHPGFSTVRGKLKPQQMCQPLDIDRANIGLQPGLIPRTWPPCLDASGNTQTSESRGICIFTLADILQKRVFPLEQHQRVNRHPHSFRPIRAVDDAQPYKGGNRTRVAPENL
jgi:hypothetical protein